MKLGWKMLYDLAGRVQDLLLFRYNSFKEDETKGGICRWISKKTNEER
jgi:Tfp pilus assembly pilus retraction ATPase PilT